MGALYIKRVKIINDIEIGLMIKTENGLK